jgi:hypothetical protein
LSLASSCDLVPEPKHLYAILRSQLPNPDQRGFLEGWFCPLFGTEEIFPSTSGPELQQSQAKQSRQRNIHTINGDPNLFCDHTTITPKSRLGRALEDLPVAAVCHDCQSFRSPVPQLILPLLLSVGRHVLGDNVNSNFLTCHAQLPAPQPQPVGRNRSRATKNLRECRVISAEKD